MFAILFILTLFLAAKYDEYSQKECVGNGYSEYFCRKNLG